MAKAEEKVVPESIAIALTAIAATALSAAVICGVGWYRSGLGERMTLEQLSVEERQSLVADFFAVSSKAYRPAWYASGVGYTLVPNKVHEAWGSTFRANELGYRSHPVAKASDVYRIVFAGDSWTYGMGVDWRESFPVQLEELAGDQAGMAKEIEAWNLALPGYNLVNEVSALEAFFGRLQPDAVVFCLTTNDNSSSHRVLPGGASTRSGVIRDDFGDDHSIMYRMRVVNSFKYWRRWELALAGLRGSVTRLERLGIPAFLFFVGTWDEPVAHRLTKDLGARVSYAVAPRHLTQGKFRAPPPWKHGTPEAYRRFARIVFSMLAPTLGWPRLPSEPEARVYAEVPPGDWKRESEEIGDRAARKTLRVRYRPGAGQREACAGPMDCVTGLMGRATTVQVLRGTGRAVVVSLRRVENARFLYPLEVEIAIPSVGGGTRTTAVVPAEGPEVHRVTVPVPNDVRQGAVLDVEIRASRTTLPDEVLAERSLYVAGIEPGE